MSQDFLAVAQIQIAANTKLFQDQLASLLATTAAIKPIQIPVVAQPVGGQQAQVAANNASKAAAASAATASQAAVKSAGITRGALEAEASARLNAAAATETDTAALTANAVASQEDAVAKQTLAAANAKDAAALRVSNARRGEAIKGVQAQALSFAGLRGAIIGANPAFLAATAATILFGKSLQTATSFQTELSVFNVTAGATADQMARVGEEARRLGKDVSLPGVSATDAATAMTELAKAGLSVQDSIAGARGVLQLATAAGIDNAQATELAASALNAFGLAGDQAVHVADVLANAANDAQGSISDIGLALGQAAVVGRQAGLTLEQTAGVLTIFARNGLKGSDSGTAFRTAMLRLINPTDKAAKIIRDLGLNIRTASGAIDLTVFDQFTQATKNMTQAERDRDLAIIFGQDAIRGAAILAREGAASLDQQTASLNKAGTAADVAAARNVGLAGATANLKNQLEALGLTLGTVASGPLATYVRGLGDTVGATAQAIDATVSFANTLQDAASHIPGFSAVGGALADAAPKALFLGAAFVNVAKDLTQLKGNATEVGSEVRKIFATSGTGDLGLNVAITRLDELSKKLAGGDAQAQKLSKTVTTLANELRSAAQQGAVFPLASIKIPPELLAGTPGKTVARITLQAFQQELAGPKIFSITSRAFKQLTPAIEQAGAEAVKAATNVAASLRLAIATGTSGVLDLQFKGASDAAIKAALQKQLERQQKLVDTLQGKGAKRVNIDAAKQAAIDTQNQIDAVQSSIDSAAQDALNKSKAAADARQKQAQDVVDARNKADAAVLGSFTGAQNRLDLRAVRANATETLRDDLALQIAIANEAAREIGIIDKTVQDQKARAAAIAQRVQTLAQAGAQIDSLRKQLAQKAKDSAAAAIQATTDLVGKKLQLAQLRGGKDQILAAFDAAIADSRKRVAAAKKAGKGVVDEQIALQQFINDRKDFLKSVSKQADDLKGQGTTAFDLLKGAAEVFNQNAGNLINAQQPFAGPTGFTADIAQFLIRRQNATGVSQPGAPRGDDVVSRAIAQNTDALRENTAAITGKKNTSTAGDTTTVSGNPWAGRRWFGASHQANRFQDD